MKWMASRLDLARRLASDKRLPTLMALAEKLAEPSVLERLSAQAADAGTQAFVSELLAVLAKPFVAVEAAKDDVPRIDEYVFSAGPRARAILRGTEIAAQDLKESGASYSLDEVRLLLDGVSRQSVDKSVREGRLLAVLGPNDKRFYPVAQFRDDGAIVEGLRAVRDALHAQNGYAILNFLVNPSPQLDDRKPIDLLKRGDVDIVVEAATLDGEQGG